MQTVVKPPTGTKWGSLKSLERVLAFEIGDDEARELMGAFFKVYELRLADAHLPSDDAKAAMEFLGIDPRDPFVMQGHRLLDALVSSLYRICRVFIDKLNAPAQ